MSDSIAFDRAAEYYDQTRAVPPEVEAQGVAAIAEAFRLDAGARVLEVGVVTGRWAIPLSRYGYRLHGTDLAMPMMWRLRSKQPGDAITLTQSDITNLPYKDGSFAGLLIVHVLHLVPNYQQAITEMRRLLQPGGVIVTVGDNVPREGDFAHLVQSKFGEFLEAQGYQDERQPTPDWSEIEAAFVQAGATQLDATTPFSWERHTTPQAEYEHIATRHWSFLWRIPDDLYQPALIELHNWLDSKFGMDAHMVSTRDFNITKVVF